MTASFRFRAGLFVLLLSAMAPALRLLGSEARKFYRAEDPDEITAYERSLSKAKDILPPRGVVGYATGRDEDGRGLYLTQYSLAPRHVVKGNGAPFVIGSFSAHDGDERQGQSVLVLKAGALAVFQSETQE